ncbi:DUF7667 family protein [Paenibacillus riograndensis]|uniref:Uncharacterized protein n=1 Tax=Paenibacillus riograndensis SBR5 TaxID=1073571 RepID=A0A0E4CVV7_9BACL|nr:hypothetical protein [Paenibacillus riograndensis]CQR54611.1 hypothetical protein PRIO_2202 [Paenibacillus riograndensis SBR5]
MLGIHQRLAELYMLSCQRALTSEEETEQRHCLQANAMYCWEMARLNNEARLAADTDDAQWQQEISAQMYEVRVTGRAGKRRK